MQMTGGEPASKAFVQSPIEPEDEIP